MSILTQVSKSMINLSRYSKRFIVIVIDISLCFLCTWLAFYLRLEQFIEIKSHVFLFATLSSALLAIPIFWLFGLYRIMFRFTGSSLVYGVAVPILTYGFTYSLFLIFFSKYFHLLELLGINGIQEIPRSVGAIQPLLLLVGIVTSRAIIRYLFINSIFKDKIRKKKNI